MTINFDKLEAQERNTARSEAHRTGNYRLDPFRDSEVVPERPSNCYGCSWERLPNNKGFRLKFKHKLCYANHVTDGTQA